MYIGKENKQKRVFYDQENLIMILDSIITHNRNLLLSTVHL